MNRQATISVNWHDATVRGAPAEIVQRALSATRHESQTVDGQVHVVPRQFTCCAVGPHGKITLAAGLVPRLRRELKRQGYAVQVHDRTQWPELLDAQAAAKCRPAANDLQQVMLRHARGQIEVHSIRQAADVIADVSSLYPCSSLLVIARNSHEVGKLRSHLEEIVPLRLRESSESRASDDDIELANVAAAVGGGVSRFALVLFLGVETSLHAQVESMLAVPPAQDVMRYALRLPASKLTPWEELRLEAMVGQAICKLYPAAGPVHVPRVCWLPSRRLSRRTTERGWQRKESLIWCNTPRNQLIAQVATAIATNSRKRLAQLGCHGVAEHLTILQQPIHVAVLVESLGHAMELSKLLPKWKVYTAESEAIELARRAIVTEAYAMEQGVGAEIVIRATAGTGDLMLKPPRTRCQKHKEVVRLLVDVADPVSHAAEQRYQDYVRHGFQVDPLPIFH